MFKNNIKFTAAACWIDSEISTTLLWCLYCWSLLCCNFYRFLVLWNFTCWSPLKVAVQIQLALLPCDLFFIFQACNLRAETESQKPCIYLINSIIWCVSPYCHLEYIFSFFDSCFGFSVFLFVISSFIQWFIHICISCGYTSFNVCWDHSFSTYAKSPEKLTFLTPWYPHVRVRIRG